VSNVLSEEKQKQVIALGQLGWSLRRIQRETGVRRETAAAYLKAAGIRVWPPGRRTTAKPAIQVTTDLEAGKAASAVTADPEPANPAIQVTTDSTSVSRLPPSDPQPSRSPSASACEPFHELIEAALARGRNAMAIWQDLVDQSGFRGAYQSVRRYVHKLGGTASPEPRAVIITAPGEEAQVDPLIRQLTLYRDLIQERTRETTE
jgi:transposase